MTYAGLASLVSYCLSVAAVVRGPGLVYYDRSTDHPPLSLGPATSQLTQSHQSVKT